VATDGVNTPDVRVGALHPSRAALAGRVLAASHADYPGLRHLFPDPARRRRVTQPFMAATARDAAISGLALVAEDDDGMLGVALWMPPGTVPLSAMRKARMSPTLLRVALAARGAFPAFVRVGAALEKDHPPGAYWYLQALGVLPRAQRRGAGTRLVMPALARADQDGVACHLHTSDPANVGYYQRFGFAVSQPAITVFADGPRYIGMTRPPSASAV
jgi:ribosomal protein S18 acetylase RimI-like enzyme